MTALVRRRSSVGGAKTAHSAPAGQHVRSGRRHRRRQGASQREPATRRPVPGNELGSLRDAAALRLPGLGSGAGPLLVDGCGERWERRHVPTSHCRRASSSGCATSRKLAAQALANADAREQLAASRARIVEAGDVERRRLERNLHDGAQQRLVALALDLTLIDMTLEKDPRGSPQDLDRGAGPARARPSTSCASWPAASTLRCSPSSVTLGPGVASAGQACAGASRDHRAAGGEAGRSGRGRGLLRRQPRRSPTWPSTRAPPTSRSASAT